MGKDLNSSMEWEQDPLFDWLHEPTQPDTTSGSSAFLLSHDQIESIDELQFQPHVTFQCKSNRYGDFQFSSLALNVIGKAHRIQFVNLPSVALAVRIELSVEFGRSQVLFLGLNHSPKRSRATSLFRILTDPSDFSFFVVPIAGKRGESCQHTLMITVWDLSCQPVTYDLTLHSAGHKYASSDLAAQRRLERTPEGLFLLQDQAGGPLTFAVQPLP